MNHRLRRLYNEPNREDIIYFLETSQKDELNALYSFADQIRKQYVGDAVHLRAIIEFSNYCRCGCLYCGINRANTRVQRYRISREEIVSIAADAYKSGYRTVVLQSGEDPTYSIDDYIYIIRKIKKLGDIAITLACGEKEEEEYFYFYSAGADRYLLKHETSDPILYDRLNPGMSLENRIKCLKTLKRIGYQTGSGIMIGLPGQTIESIADDILFFLEMDIDMIGCGPFIPHPDTPLKDSPVGSEELTYRVLAINRIVTRNTLLPATTALSTINEHEGRKLALMRGANVVMPNVTPLKYRQLYEIYPNKKRIEVSSTDMIRDLETQFHQIGRYISHSPGDRYQEDPYIANGHC